MFGSEKNFFFLSLICLNQTIYFINRHRISVLFLYAKDRKISIEKWKSSETMCVHYIRFSYFVCRTRLTRKNIHNEKENFVWNHWNLSIRANRAYNIVKFAHECTSSNELRFKLLCRLARCRNPKRIYMPNR